MNTTRPSYELSLPARGLFEIPDIARVQVTCSRGALWVTLDNDPRDIVLEAGETFFSHRAPPRPGIRIRALDPGVSS